MLVELTIRRSKYTFYILLVKGMRCVDCLIKCMLRLDGI